MFSENTDPAVAKEPVLQCVKICTGPSPVIFFNIASEPYDPIALLSDISFANICSTVCRNLK